jgi:hypothetical protein
MYMYNLCGDATTEYRLNNIICDDCEGTTSESSNRYRRAIMVLKSFAHRKSNSQ